MALKYIEKETAAENVVIKMNIMDICWYHCSMDTFKIVGTVINDFYWNLKLNLKNEAMFKHHTRIETVISF